MLKRLPIETAPKHRNSRVNTQTASKMVLKVLLQKVLLQMAYNYIFMLDIQVIRINISKIFNWIHVTQLYIYVFCHYTLSSLSWTDEELYLILQHFQN